jgi:hypothetical protein
MGHKRTEILLQLLTKIEANIPHKAAKNPSVSKATVGWQLDHALKVFNAVSEWTENSNPEDYEFKLNYWRTVLLTLGYFPRGRVKAPKHVLPPESITTEDLEKQLQTARTHVDKLKMLPKNAYFKHFIFGKLNKKQTLRFLEVHTNHHLKIVKAILKN